MSTHKISIAARLRPLLLTEQGDDQINVFQDPVDANSSSGSFITVGNPRDVSQQFKFPFTSCYDENSTQEEIFERDVRPMVDVVYSGVTVTIFAYGVTSSGKTHTMQGTKSDPGVIPRVVRAIFEKKSTFQTHDVALAVSYMEIYKDEVYDLLVTRENAPKLPVRENDVGQVFVANLTSIPITSVDDFDSLYARATKHRSTSSTNLNHASSRSHAVLTIDVELTSLSTEKMLTGKINLVDLAGSENNKLTGNDPSRMAESAAINKSLSVLGQVVHALNQGASRIPYRNSKLTRILQDALGGSSVGLLICNLAPGVKFRQDTLNTLNFAVRTKNVENKPVINERDIRPPPKSHFAAHQPAAPKLAPAILQPISAAAGSSRLSFSFAPNIHAPRSSRIGGPRSSLVGPGLRRSSGVGAKPRPSRVPRLSVNGMGVFQPFGLPKAGEGSGSSLGGLSEKEIDERIAKAVETKVARILEEREMERLRGEEQRQATTNITDNQGSSPKLKETLPPGVLTPLLKRHRDLDDELKQRLHDLERKFERGNKEVQLADVLSPVSKKRTGRAYVALARAHSEKGDLQVALDLYRKAESYVPDNMKLKERIIEIEWSVKNNTLFVPSPKRPKKVKSKAKSKSKYPKSAKKAKVKPTSVQEMVTEDEDENGVTSSGAEAEQVGDASKEKAQLRIAGMEVTNSNITPTKRSVVQLDAADEEENMESPAKRQRKKTVNKHKEQAWRKGGRRVVRAA